jgi:hypothetical protein
MRALVISPTLLQKLQDKHNVTRREVEQCFENKIGNYLEDDREEHRTDPPTLWFVAPTNCDRLLKVIFVFLDGNIYIKSAYEPTPQIVEMYDRYGR